MEHSIESVNNNIDSLVNHINELEKENNNTKLAIQDCLFEINELKEEPITIPTLGMIIKNLKSQGYK